MSKKRINAETKVKLLRELLKNDVPKSELAERYNVSIVSIDTWEKALFEGALETFQPQKTKAEKRRIANLEETLTMRNGLISDLVEDNIRMKKKLHGAP